MIVIDSFPAGTIRDGPRSPSWDAAVAVWPPSLPGFLGLQGCQKAEEGFFSRSFNKFKTETSGHQKLEEAKGRERLVFLLHWLALNSARGNRSVFVTNVQSFPAWCINDNIFAFQPPNLSSLVFCGTSQLKDYLFKFTLEI